MPPTSLLISIVLLAATPEEYEAQIRAELAEMAPDALDAFDRAAAARNANDALAALAAYEEVHRLAPKFSHALRRICQAEHQLGRIEAARQHCRDALALADLPQNQVALAVALLDVEPGAQPSGEVVQEAERLIARAASIEPNELYVQGGRCTLAIAMQRSDDLADCSARMLALDPNRPDGYLYRAVYLAVNGELAEAEAQLDEAEARGFPAEANADLRRRIEDAMPIHLVAWKWIERIGAPWAIGLLALVLLGFVLSSLTLASAKRSSEVASAEVRGVSALLRKVYAAVLWLCCAYYYASLPLVLVMVLGGAAALIYGFVALGHIPIKIVAIIAIIALASSGAVFKGIAATFSRGKDEDPGEKIDLSEHPRLLETLREVAEKIGTRPVDSVYLDVDASIAVLERGGMLDQMRGRSERCLVLGVAALDGMKLGELKAILAHEYGHFQNEDTAGGGFALAVRRSMITMAISLAQSGAATWYNPAWLFFRGFYWIFMRISQGASRLQEILADRWAALAYGSEAFVRGLRHVIRRSIEFDAHVHASFNDVVERKLAVHNLYTHVPADPSNRTEIDEAVEEAWNRPPSAFDSHPAPRDREAWVRAMNAAEPTDEGGSDEAWALFSDREAIQQKMTALIRERVLLNHGVDIQRPGEAAA